MLDIEEEVHYIAILHDVILTLDPHLAGGAHGRLGLVLDEVVVLDHLGADEALLEVGVDDAGGLGGLVAAVDGPGAALVGAGRKEGLQAQQVIGALYLTVWPTRTLSATVLCWTRTATR